MNYLIKTTEEYRAPSENAAIKLIEDARADNKFILLKYNCTKKDVKVKGEVVDEYYVVTLTKVFNDIKEPTDTVQVSYDR